MAKMFADEVQNIMGVPSRQVVARGYTVRRDTVELYFDLGRLVCRIDGVDVESSTYLEPRFFTGDYIKRWYENGVHPWLIQMFETFDRFGLPLTPGGQSWGDSV